MGKRKNRKEYGELSELEKVKAVQIVKRISGGKGEPGNYRYQIRSDGKIIVIPKLQYFTPFFK